MPITQKTFSASSVITGFLLLGLSMAFVVQKLVNFALVVASLYALYLFVSQQAWRSTTWQNLPHRHLLGVLAAPFFLSLLLDILKGSWNVAQLDEYLRILLALPVLYWLMASFNTRAYRWFQPLFALAFMLLLALYWSGWSTAKWAYGDPRASTYFVDANTMGIVALVGTYFCAYHAVLGLHRKAIAQAAWYGAGLGAAAYLLFASQTRMAWIAALLMVPLALLYTRRRLLVLAAAVLLVLIAASTSPIVQKRIVQAQVELSDYFSGKPVDLTSSLGQRLSFYHAAVVVGMDQPLLGHGADELRNKISTEPQRLGLNDQTKASLLQHGVHNQYLEKLMLNGLAGFLASLALYLVPLVFFFRALQQRRGGAHESAAFLGVVLCSAYFFSGLSMILTLKYINSFYAGLVVLLYATIHRSATGD